MYDKDLATIDATGTRIELAVSSYHSEITDALCAGAVRCFMECRWGKHASRTPLGTWVPGN